MGGRSWTRKDAVMCSCSFLRSIPPSTEEEHEGGSNFHGHLDIRHNA